MRRPAIRSSQEALERRCLLPLWMDGRHLSVCSMYVYAYKEDESVSQSNAQCCIYVLKGAYL